MSRVLSQISTPSGSAARIGSDLAGMAQKGGYQPLLVIGGVIILIAIIVLVIKMKRDQ